MAVSGTVRTLPILGRMAGVVAGSITLVVVVWLSRYAVSHGGPWWGGAGLLPLIFLLRLAVAGWVGWAVIRFDERALLRVLLAAFAVSFLLLYGWYLLFLGFDNGIFYLAVAADFLYLAGALVIGCASRLANVTRAGNGHA
jgi:hypothetical protein